MLAEAVELDVLDEHHLRAVLAEDAVPTTSAAVCR
jgi:hypothetical protein